MNELDFRVHSRHGLRVIARLINEGIVGFVEQGDGTHRVISRLIHHEAIPTAPKPRTPDVGMWQNYERLALLGVVVRNELRIAELRLCDRLDRLADRINESTRRYVAKHG